MKTKNKEEVIDVKVEENNSPVSKFEIAKQSAIVKPVDVEGTLEAYRQFEELKTKLLTDKDFMYFDEYGKPTTKDKGTPFIKKSGWRKYKTAFGVTIQYLDDGIRTEGEDKEGKYYVWRYKVRAIAPNGIYQDSDGAASSRKAFFSKKKGQRIDPEEEDIILTAQTVAINRAVSDLVGGGEVSAEEMIGKPNKTKKTTNAKFKSNEQYWKEYDFTKVNLEDIPPNRGFDKTKNKPKSSEESLKIYFYACEILPKKEVQPFFESITGKQKSWEYTYDDIQNILTALEEIRQQEKSDEEKITDDFEESEQGK